RSSWPGITWARLRARWDRRVFSWEVLMKLNWIFGAFGLLTVFSACGGSSEKTQKTQPVALGQRGETCQARNDCSAGLACISGVCSKNDFDITVSAKHCDQVDCQGTADCCGN